MAKKKNKDLAGMAMMIAAATGGAVLGKVVDNTLGDKLPGGEIGRHIAKLAAGIGIGYAISQPIAVNVGAGLALSGTYGIASKFLPMLNTPSVSGMPGAGYIAGYEPGYIAAASDNYLEVEPGMYGTGEEVSDVIEGTGDEIEETIGMADDYADEWDY